MFSNTADVDDPRECIRKIINRAVLTGKAIQSPQTGFIHWHSQYAEDGIYHTIPLQENLLFALALLRTHQSEHVHEAKSLLEKLFAFQIPAALSDGGLFPTYIHEYPIAHDKLIGLHLLIPLYRILDGYGHILGAKLKEAVFLASKRLLTATADFMASSTIPYHFQVVFWAASAVFSRFDNDDSSYAIALDNLHLLSKQEDSQAWLISERAAMILSAISMVYDFPENSPWMAFCAHLYQCWDEKSGNWCGPPLEEWHSLANRKITLLNLLMGIQTDVKCLSNVAIDKENFNDVFLKGAMVYERPFYHHFTKKEFVSGNLNGNTWQRIIKDKFIWSTIEQASKKELSNAKGYFPLRLSMQDPLKAYSLVLYSPEAQTINFNNNRDDSYIEALITIPVDDEGSDSRKAASAAVSIFIDSFNEDEHSPVMLVNGLPATLWNLGDRITLKTATSVIDLSFELVSGCGIFVGHSMPGNRPSQLSCKGKKKFNTYDWQIFLRPLRLQESCQLKIGLYPHDE